MIEAASDALRNERMVLGESVFKFEEEFARFIGTKHAVSVSSGTAALQLSLICCGVRGREVVTTPLSFIATANSVVEAGGTPKFADVRVADYNIDPVEAAKAVSGSTAALLPVHFYGRPCDMDPLSDLCEERGIALVEDAAQAHGAIYKGRRVGSIGDVGCFSFYPTKNMTVGGDGGMITTDDGDLAREVSKLRDCGRVSRYVHDKIGFTSRLNSANAAFGRVQLRHLEEWNERRRSVAALYRRRLRDIEGISLPLSEDVDVEPVFHLFVVRCKQRDELVSYLAECGVETGVHYPLPIHLQPVYRELYGYSEGAYPVSESLSKILVSLPIFPALKDEEVSYVCDRIRAFFGGR